MEYVFQGQHHGLVCGFDLEIGSDGFFDLTGLPPIVGIRIPRRRR